MKFKYNGETYPLLLENDVEQGYERQLVIIPEITGDYFLAEISSAGEYKVEECIAFCEVEIII